jgi:glycosyltransferase involved in cell wall biosynthesis
MKVKFSIITVVYNASKVLEKTLLSVINQTYNNIEYIIIDGGSADGTVDLIKQYRSGLYYWISEPDKGIYDAMNKGLRVATGDYVWFLNAGDTLQHHNIVTELAIKAESAGMPDILYGETDLMDSEGHVFAKRRLKAPRRLTWKSFSMGMLVCHQAFIAKRSIAPEFDLQYRFSADFDWCIRCLKKAGKIGESVETGETGETPVGANLRVYPEENVYNTQLRLVNYLYEGATTANRKASLKERYHIMCRYYGAFPTRLRHLWFAIRSCWATLFKNNY